MKSLLCAVFLLARPCSGFGLPLSRIAARSGARPRTAASVTHAKKVFIDGEAGTTGLQVRDRLEARSDIELLTLPDDLRKDESARAEQINAADAVVLCLPDEAAIAAVGLVKSDNTRTVIIDASTAYRTNPDWAYGFPELCESQRSTIASSRRISNPGCYPTGFIGLTRPLIDAGLLDKEASLSVSAVSGYSGGGKALMQIYEGPEPNEPWGAYGLSLTHKHMPEMAFHTGLEKPPIFLPAVGAFAQGMVVSVPIHYSRDLTPKASGLANPGAALHEALTNHYKKNGADEFVKVMPFGEAAVKDAGLLERGAFLRPDELNGSNLLQLFVFADDAAGRAVLVARLDNLGKGASGAAVQNLNIALGLDQATGLAPP